jgi:hypothetical protein
MLGKECGSTCDLGTGREQWWGRERKRGEGREEGLPFEKKLAAFFRIQESQKSSLVFPP